MSDALTGEERREASGRLAELRELIASPQHVSNVLPEAISMHPHDPALIKALGPAVEDVLDSSVRSNPQGLADALFPVMGPAIRKSLSHALAETLEGLNRTLEHSFSPRSLAWRFEAMRAGKPFAEVVLLHTMLFRVEQVYLIHGETGLLLHHVASEEAAVLDTDMVSGMFSAIRDFVRDSFGGNKTDTLDEMKVGERTVVVVPGPRAALAAVVRGTPPHELQTKLQETIETIHLRLGKFFDNFAGDTAPFVAAGPYMEGCLISQQRDEEKAPLALRVATAVMLVVLGWWIFDSLRDARRWNEYLRLLAAEPGLVVVSAERGWGKHSLVGLRDPLSNDPMEILSSKTDIDPTTVTSRWEPYQALLPKFIVMRAKSLLQPPPEVTLSFENGILYAKGPMSAEWLADSSRLAKSLPGVSVLQRGESLESVLERVRGPIEGTRVKFASNQSDPLPGEEAKLDALALQLQEVAAASMRAVHPARLQVDGYADPTGTEAGNMTLSENRAKKIREILIPKIGSPPLEIVATGHGAQTGKEHDESYDKASARRVTLHVVQSSVERKGR